VRLGSMSAAPKAEDIRQRLNDMRPRGFKRSETQKLDADQRDMMITAEWLRKDFIADRLGARHTIVTPDLVQAPDSCDKLCCVIMPVLMNGAKESDALPDDMDRVKQIAESVREQLSKSGTTNERASSGIQRLSVLLLARLHAHAIFTRGHLEDTCMQGTLEHVLECKGVSDAISEYFDKRAAARRRETPLISFFMSLSGSLEAMDEICVHYGLAGALVLSMSFANFGSLSKEDWQNYLFIALAENKCQAQASSCKLNQLSSNLLGWEELYCQSALEELVDDPSLNITGTDMECCLPAIVCVKQYLWNLEALFTVGCGGGSACMLLVVLFTSWLYISLHASKANRSRYAEARLLTARFRQEFVFLHCLFVVGIGLCFTGIISVMSLKVNTIGQSYLVFAISLGSSAASCCALFKCGWEIFFLNRSVDTLRDMAHFDKTKASVSIHRMTLGSTEKELQSCDAEMRSI